METDIWIIIEYLQKSLTMFEILETYYTDGETAGREFEKLRTEFPENRYVVKRLSKSKF